LNANQPLVQAITALTVLLAISGLVALLAHVMNRRGRRRSTALFAATPDKTAAPETRSSMAARKAPPWRKLARAGAGLVLVGIITFTALRLSTPSSNPEIAAGPAANSPPPTDANHHPRGALSTEQLQKMVNEVTARIENEPKDPQAWAMLAHSYEMMGKYPEAVQAFAKLAELLPNDAQVLADYADALAVAQGRSLAGEPIRLIGRSLALDPVNLKSLALAGTEAFERKSYAEAVAFWERARRVSKDPAFSRQLDSDIAQANALQGRPQSAGPDTTQVPAMPAEGASHPGAVSGLVSLSDSLKPRADPDDTVFILARPVEGSKMPVALTRKRVRDLPLKFVLDDSAAMVADMPLSKFKTVIVIARISKRGDAIPQAGDLQAISAPVAIGTRDLKLFINEVVH
jgi:cytochrome c-type biogenesis protein CcmH